MKLRRTKKRVTSIVCATTVPNRCGFSVDLLSHGGFFSMAGELDAESADCICIGKSQQVGIP